MKKKLFKLASAAFVLCLLFDFTGCQLARPEQHGPNRDAFIGFHLVSESVVEMRDEQGEIFHQIGNSDRSQWVEYGTEEMELDGFGTVSFPRQILIGTYNEETRRYDFPGKEGFNCFLAVRTDEDGTTYINGYTDMTETKLDRKITDEEEENVLKTALYMGTIKAGEPFYDTILTAYRVYQMEDGTVYLDGTGNSYGGAGFTINERSEYVTTVNGESTKRVLEIEFSLKDAERLERLDVTWFGEEDEVLLREQLPLEELEGEYTLAPPAGSAWAMVRETDERGNVTRTVMEPNYTGWAGHRLILLNDYGVGRAVTLRWQQN